MKNRKGFTLVELLAVIVVLAIIMIIAIPAVFHRDRIEYWLRMVEPRYRRAYVRIPGRALGGALVSAWLFQPDQSSAFQQLAVHGQRALEFLR